MELIELTTPYKINKKQLLLNLINILKPTTKNVKKKEKKSAQNFFILKYVIKSFTASNFYKLKVLV